jgi:hypothetical protein
MLNSLPSRQEAAKEILRRRNLRASFTDWCRETGYEPARHHRLLIEKLKALERGEIRRLLVTMPPGSAKSTYTSVLFPPWFLARNPRSNVIAASHTTELAEKFGRRVRNLIAEHCHTLELFLADDNKAAGRWATTDGGEYYAAGCGVGIAGFRADLAIIDDPIRSREDADSPAIRDKIWDWYKADLGPRLRPRARIVLIQTRWHEDDLAGRCLEEMAKGTSEWEILSLPAEAQPGDPLGRKPGELLWTDGNYGYASFLHHEHETQTPRNWSALYQQSPAPEGGNFFKAEWLRPYDEAPARETLSIYGGSDYAVTADGGDYTVHVVIGADPQNRIWLLDLWRAQASSDVWISSWCDLVKQWKPLDWAEERDRSRAASARSEIPRRLRGKPSRISSCSRREVTRLYERSQLEVVWPWGVYTFPFTLLGLQISERSCSVSPRVSTTIRLTPSGSSGSSSTK